MYYYCSKQKIQGYKNLNKNNSNSIFKDGILDKIVYTDILFFIIRQSPNFNHFLLSQYIHLQEMVHLSYNFILDFSFIMLLNIV